MPEPAKTSRAELPDPLSHTVMVGGVELDLDRMPTLTLGHKRRLWKEHSVDLSNIGRFTPEDEFRFALFMLRLLRPETTEAEVEMISMSTVADIAVIAVRKLSAKAGVSLPFSTSSPISPGGGDGDPAS